MTKLQTERAWDALGNLRELCLLGIAVDPVGPMKLLSDLLTAAEQGNADFVSVPVSLVEALTDHFDPSERIVGGRVYAIKMLAALVGKEVGTYQVETLSEPEPAEPPTHKKYTPPFTSSDGRTDRVYLSGPMTGIENFNFPAFNEMAAKLRELGLHVENPADHGIVEGAEWGDYLRHDLARMVTCETIALLPGWSKSKGAKLELQVAQALGMKIRILDGAEPLTRPWDEF